MTFDLQPQHDFLVGIDSDGCAFDTMEVKHKECFIPNTINSYELQGISKYAREAAEFVNLYSKSRGINRFPALIETLQWLVKRPEVRARGVTIRIPHGLVAWIGRETKLANPALADAVEETGDPDLKQALNWSQAVNETVARIVRGVPPFPFVRESLEKLTGRADLLVVSATPHEALGARMGGARSGARTCGRSAARKSAPRRNRSASRQKYPAGHTLMIGDAPGDYSAAVANRALFFPINPGAEEASWRRLLEEGIDRFLAGKFAGDYQQTLLDEFHRFLPERPPWPMVDN